MIYTADGRIVYVIDIDGVERAIKTTEDTGKKAGGKFEEVMKGAARRVGEAFVNMAARAASSIVDISKAGIEFNAKVEQYTVALTTLLGTEEEAARVMAQIREDAARTPFDVDSLTSANQMLISAGVSAEQSREDILNLANAISATGGGSAELSRMAANLQQIKNTGKATAMDIRQFANAGINIYGLLADSMGVTVEEASKLDVSYDSLTAALEKAASAGGKYAGSLEAQSRTFKGRISTLKDNATQLAGALTRDLFSTLSDNALPMVQDMVAELLSAAETDGIRGALQAAKNIVKKLLDQISAAAPQMASTGISLLAKLVDGIGKAIPTVTSVAVDVLLAIVDGIVGNIDGIIDAGISVIEGLIDGLMVALPKLIARVPAIIMSIAEGLLRNVDKIMSAGLRIIRTLGEGLIKAIPQLVEKLPAIVNRLLGFFTDASSISKIITTGIKIMVQLATGLVKALLDPQFIGALGNAALGIAAALFNFDWLGLGRDIIYGILDGVKSVATTVHDEFTKLTSWIFGSNSGLESMLNDAELAIKAAGGTDADIARIRSSAKGGFGGGGFGGNREAWERSTFGQGGSSGRGGRDITVPVYLNGREIARATARQMGEQMAWTEV